MNTNQKSANGCFGCGEANPRGMHLQFEWNEVLQKVRGVFVLGEEYAGASGMIHGGIIAVVLDEALGKVSRFCKVRTVTAELTVKYLRPIRVGESIYVEAEQLKREGRSFYHEGRIHNASGEVLALAKGRFVEIDPETFRSKIQAMNDADRIAK